MQKLSFIILIIISTTLAYNIAISSDAKMESSINIESATQSRAMSQKTDVNPTPLFIACQENPVRSPGETEDEYQERVQAQQDECQMAQDPHQQGFEFELH